MDLKAYLANERTIGLLPIAVVRRLLPPVEEAPGWIEALSDEELVEALRSLARLQRLRQRCVADPSLRARVAAEPRPVLAEFGLAVDPEEIRPIWDLSLAINGEGGSPLMARYGDFQQRRIPLKSLLARAGEIRNPRVAAWHQRQRARMARELLPAAERGDLHAPVCYELSQGCSVGCWFCGLAAPKLTANWRFTSENAALWRAVLEEVREVLGPAASMGFCYWATDPLDNPDYEQFMQVFHEVNGSFPQTTTALSLKDPARTRALLRLSGEKGCSLNRFSVLSLGMLEALHREFTAEELAFVGLVFRNQESGLPVSNAGRARACKRPPLPLDERTSSCVSGFRFNMVERTVQLISPCPANERWPLGHLIFAEEQFDNARDLRALLDRMIVDFMPTEIHPGDRLCFRQDLAYHGVDDGFHLTNCYLTLKFGGDPFIRQVGDLINDGNHTASEVVAVLDLCGVPVAATRRCLDRLFRDGVLDEEPKPAGSRPLALA
jgi:radical SAM family RiPP maturation amino acid epimerase